MLTWKWRLLYFFTFFPLGLCLFIVLSVRAIFIFLSKGTHRLLARLFQNSRPQEKKNKTDLLCLAYLTDENASARQRLFKFVPGTEKRINFVLDTPTSFKEFNNYYKPWKHKGHYIYFLIVFYKRFLSIWKAPKFDAVLLQRELLSEFFYDPPFFIFILKCLNPKLIYDIDDSIWMLPPHSKKSQSYWLNYLARARFFWNVKLSRHVITSNRYIQKKINLINSSSEIIPTLVRVKEYPAVEHSEKTPVAIGWIGGAGNLSYLKIIQKPLSHIASKYNIVLRIISSSFIRLNDLPVEFIQWEKNSAAQNMRLFDIGIMPLPENPYTKGKGGYKILEYMAAGLPSIASPVGVNVKIVQEGVTGFLAKDETDWENTLEKLVTDVHLRRRMGKKARDFVLKNYDYQAWEDHFVDSIEKVSGNS